MAKTIIAHYPLSEPSKYLEGDKVWDISENKNHGDFGNILPTVIEAKINGTYAMEWVGGAVVTLPPMSPMSIVYWVKQGAGSTLSISGIQDSEWHMVAASGGTLYIDGEIQLQVPVTDIQSQLENAMNGGSGFSLSDIWYFGETLTVEEILNMYKVKTKITKDGNLVCKEFVESDTVTNVRVVKSGTVTAGSGSVQEIEGSVVSFGQQGVFKANEIVEQ